MADTFAEEREQLDKEQWKIVMDKENQSKEEEQ
jgi:hypothetical protein